MKTTFDKYLAGTALSISRRHVPYALLIALSSVILVWHQLHSWSPIPFLVFTIALFPISLFTDERSNSVTHRHGHILMGLANGILISGLALSIKNIVPLGWFSVNLITDFSWISFATVLALITSIWAIHLVLYHSQKAIHLRSNNEKLIYYSIVSAILVSFTYHSVDISIFASVICAVYFLLLDLFLDQKRPTLIWLVVWTIVLGSFLALLIFHSESVFILNDHIPLINAFSLFSLIFILSALLYVPLAIANQKWQILPVEWDFSFKNHSQLRYRIQFSILVTLIFSFVAIGFVSVYQIKLLAPGDFAPDFQSRFTQALLNTYVFLFLIGFVISISLSEYIRTPLVELGKTLKAVKLNKTNKKINWEGQDEIGKLIHEYNQMIEKLEDNAQLLAQTERDSAWREMSKQVAHEIKNPLTPMKLSLQHLERCISMERDDIEQITLRMCSTLMSQVENLKQIADEFSNFGSLPRANNEKVILNNIAETIHDLFRKREDMDIRLIEPIDDIGVYADKNHLVRILNNLVKNSIQAIPSDRKGVIELKLWKEETKAIIRVRDNGAGIPDQMKDQIFKPKFTTKSSGSGLGLAIAANMVESMGGSIYFESEDGRGTDFFVELPLIRNEYAQELQRVEL